MSKSMGEGKKSMRCNKKVWKRPGRMPKLVGNALLEHGDDGIR